MIPVFKPSLGHEEEKNVVQTLRSGWIGNGPKTAEFEKAFAKKVGAKYALALNSASAALHLALVMLNLKPEDEVITPSLTFVATNHPILLVGATPVFSDINTETLCVDPKDIIKKITKRTKVIIIMYYGGQPIDLKNLLKICKKNKITLIEDCSHAEGTFYKNKHVGVFGDLGCFSFAAIKNMTTGDGGMLVARKKKYIEYARALAWSGIKQSTWERTKGKKFKWRYDVIAPGWKYQMNDVAASIGLAQLKKLDKNNIKRKKIASMYCKKLRDIPWIEIPKEPTFGRSSWHNFAIKVPAKLRNKLIDYLSKNGVGASVHYIPSHKYKLYSKYKADVPVTNKIWGKILLLPMFPDLKNKEQKYIIDLLYSFPDINIK